MKVYLVGMNMRARRSMNCIPRKVFTPMYISTPYSTGIGISLEGNMIMMVVVNVLMYILENGGKLCGESDKEENTDASDSLEKKKEINKVTSKHEDIITPALSLLGIGEVPLAHSTRYLSSD